MWVAFSCFAIMLGWSLWLTIGKAPQVRIMYWLSVSAALEVIGYGARYGTLINAPTLAIYILSTCCLVIVAIPLSAINYSVTGRIVAAGQASGGSVLRCCRPQWIGRLFLIGDVLCFFGWLQCMLLAVRRGMHQPTSAKAVHLPRLRASAAILLVHRHFVFALIILVTCLSFPTAVQCAGAQPLTSTDANQRQLGKHINVTGIAMQLSLFTLYVYMLATVGHSASFAKLRETFPNFKQIYRGLALTIACLYIRNIFRATEFISYYAPQGVSALVL